MESVQNETEVKQAMKLTRGEQKRAISSGKKGRRQVVHTTLDSPFDITWPEISSEDQDRIETLFKESLVSLRMPNERFSKAELQGIPRSERNLARKKRRLEALGESLLQQRQDQKLEVKFSGKKVKPRRGLDRRLFLEEKCYDPFKSTLGN